MILIHGFTGSHKGFQYIIPLLPNIRFIVPDLPGFGESTIDKKDWSITAIARIANEFVASLDLPKPPLILGHSMGGLVVANMLSQNPELYDRKVILVAPVPTALRRNDKRRGGAILGALQYSVGHRLPKLGPKVVKSQLISAAVTNLIMTTTNSQLRKEIHGHHFDNLDYISSIEFYSKLHGQINRMGAIDYAKALNKFDILLLASEKDIVTPPAEQKKLAAAIKPERFVVIPGVGHLAHYEAPRQICDAVADFLR